MYGGVLLEVLETVARVPASIPEFFSILASTRIRMRAYPRSAADRRRARRKADDDAEKKSRVRERERYYSYLYKLKRDGLIVRKGKEGEACASISLTPTGARKLALLRAQHKKRLPHTDYSPLAAQQFTIVAFDVPEYDRKKRDWLRAVLKNLGLSMIQKSVWIGKVKLPEELVEDMKAMGILDYVEIFEISKTGSLRHIA